ncbi:MAG: replicative DNA helicase [Candidatus Shapirobacteria bacterium]|jgi:replicative DNA helicase
MNAPPQDLNIEKAVLGAILLEKDAIYTAIQIIKPNAFYSDNHNIIYNAIYKLYTERKPIDLLTVSNELRESNKLDSIGGAYYISSLTNNVGSCANLENHCKILYELFLRREMIRTLMSFTNVIDNDYEKDIFESYNNISAELSSLFELSLSSDYHNMKDVISERLNKIAEIKPNENNLIGINTGFSRLNSFTNGLQSGDYVIIGARPSMGKTIISLLIARAAIFQSKKKVLYFSLEMNKERIADRLLSIESKIDSKKIASNRLDNCEWKNLDESQGLYNNKDFFIIDNSGMTIEDIKARCITLHRKFGIDEVIIDYIQLIKHSFKNRNTNDNVTHISKNIKAIAKEINCPIIALSQLNRGGVGRPEMKDLRDSGSLEQDADIIWLLHREDYEGCECLPEAINRIDNIIAKNRNGDVGAFYTYRNDIWSYIGEIRFEELASIENQMPFNAYDGIDINENPFNL